MVLFTVNREDSYRLYHHPPLYPCDRHQCLQDKRFHKIKSTWNNKNMNNIQHTVK